MTSKKNRMINDTEEIIMGNENQLKTSFGNTLYVHGNTAKQIL